MRRRDSFYKREDGGKGDFLNEIEPLSNGIQRLNWQLTSSAARWLDHSTTLCLVAKWCQQNLASCDKLHETDTRAWLVKMFQFIFHTTLYNIHSKFSPSIILIQFHTISSLVHAYSISIKNFFYWKINTLHFLYFLIPISYFIQISNVLH